MDVDEQVKDAARRAASINRLLLNPDISPATKKALRDLRDLIEPELASAPTILTKEQVLEFIRNDIQSNILIGDAEVLAEAGWWLTTVTNEINKIIQRTGDASG